MRFTRSPEMVRPGFSLIELLVVVGVIAILASLILAAVIRAKNSGRKTECLNNQNQLIKTWALYHTDNNGDLVSNFQWPRRGRYAQGTTERHHIPWVSGTGHPNVTGMVDKSLLLDEQYAAFAPYIRRAEVYRCPSNREVLQGTETQRSYSMNSYMGRYLQQTWHIFRGSEYFRFLHVDDITQPEHFFVFIEINQKFICVPFMAMYMEDPYWHHPPGTIHNMGGTLAFADGHVEYKRWLEHTTKGNDRHPRWRVGPHRSPAQPNDRDLAWIRERTSFKITQ